MNFEKIVLLTALSELLRRAQYFKFEIGLSNFGDLYVKAWPANPRVRTESRLRSALSQLGIDAVDRSSYSGDICVIHNFTPSWQTIRNYVGEHGTAD